MGLANVIEESEAPHSCEYSEAEVENIQTNYFPHLQEKNYKELTELGFTDDKIEHSKYPIFHQNFPVLS